EARPRARRARAGEPGGARQADHGIGLVGRAVAVVVEAVAHLDAGLVRDAIREDAAQADGHRDRARADAAALLAEAVVHLAVAVVVERVALLLRREDLALARAEALRAADLHAGQALAHAQRRRIARVARLGLPGVAGARLIDLAVAVVVD